MARRLFKEDDLQAAQVKYLESRRATVRDVMFCAVPNAAQMITSGARKNYRLAAYLRQQGLVPGAPDLIIWLRGATLHIENKVKGNTPSDAQEAFGEGLKALGHFYHVLTAETPADAVDQLQRLIEGALKAQGAAA